MSHLGPTGRLARLGQSVGGETPLPAGCAELTAILSPLESGCLRTQPPLRAGGERGLERGAEGGQGGCGESQQARSSQPRVQLRREQLGPDVRFKNLLLCFSSLELGSIICYQETLQECV